MALGMGPANTTCAPTRTSHPYVCHHAGPNGTWRRAHIPRRCLTREGRLQSRGDDNTGKAMQDEDTADGPIVLLTGKTSLLWGTFGNQSLSSKGRTLIAQRLLECGQVTHKDHSKAKTLPSPTPENKPFRAPWLLTVSPGETVQLDSYSVKFLL